MKSFYQYLAESAKTHKYRIKTIKPIDDDFISTVSRTLFKYEIMDISEPKKIPYQKAPLDFRDFDVVDIYILDVTTKYPASSYVLACDLRGVMNLPDRELVVRGENEPLEIEAKVIEEFEKEEEKPVLEDPNYEEEDQPAEIAFGDEYNKKFLTYLAQVKANSEAKREEEIKKATKENKLSWLYPEKEIADDFNKDFDTVKPVHYKSVKTGKDPVEPNLTAASGNYDETIKKGRKS